VLDFLSYREKYLAGSWRFDTYFGRDTLMTLILLRPVLAPDALESGIGSVLRRLSASGEVAHEEQIGEFAILRNAAAGRGRTDSPIYDYDMIDEGFMLAPLVVSCLLDERSAHERADRFLARRDNGGLRNGDALVRNLLWVVRRTAAFAQQPSVSNLVGLKDGQLAGDWRDSPDGLDGGRYPYDVNVALIPAALRATERLAGSGLLDPYLQDPHERQALAVAGRQLIVWERAAPPLFRVQIAATTTRTAVTRYAQVLGIEPRSALASLPAEPLVFDALALDASGRPLPALHSDEGFTLLLARPPAAVIQQITAALLRPFPAGLMTTVGIVVADAAYAGTRAQSRFSNSAYHGAVVWSWQEALLIAGIDHQLRRRDLPEPVRAELRAAGTAVWSTLARVGERRNSELWSWSFAGGRYQMQPFEPRGANRDESDAAQLWSTVFLALDDSSARIAGH
jgi:hypothetical protein